MRARGARQRGFLRSSQRGKEPDATIFAVVMAWPV
jgi:hypothetical protein